MKQLSGVNIDHIYSERLPGAEDIIVLAAIKLKNGDVIAPEQAIPVYLRNDVAKKSSK